MHHESWEKLRTGLSPPLLDGLMETSSFPPTCCLLAEPRGPHGSTALRPMVAVFSVVLSCAPRGHNTAVLQELEIQQCDK